MWRWPVRWKPWLLASLSVLFLACATASEPLLTATLIVGGPNSKRALGVTGREFTVTLTQIGADKKLKVETASGTLEKEEYRRLLAHFDGLDLASFKELYTSRDMERTGRTTTVRVSYKGVAKNIIIIGQPPAAVKPLLALLLPLLNRPL